MALKHFIIDLDNNVNKFQLPYPYTYEGDTGFVLINYKGDVVFVTSTKVKNVEHLFDNAVLDDGIVIVPPVIPDKCNLVLSFVANPVKVIIDTYNVFTVYIKGNSDNMVQFKSSLEDWKDATLGTTGTIIKTLASGNSETIYSRVKGCTNQISISLPTLKYEGNDGAEEEVGTWTGSVGSVLILKQVKDLLWLLQTDKNRTYYVIRGKNFPADDNRVKLIRPIDISLLANDVTTQGGLGQTSVSGARFPAKWDEAWWESKGYMLNNNNEWVKGVIGDCVDITWTTKESKCENGVSMIRRESNCGTTEWIKGGTACDDNCVDSVWSNILDASGKPVEICDNGVSKIRQKSNCGETRLINGGSACNTNTGNSITNTLTLSPEETKKNWVSWENFQGKETSLPKGYDAVLGFGSPIYSNDPASSDGIHLALKIGYTHACNLTAFPKAWNRYKEENIYLFTQPFQLIENAAKRLISLINGGAFSTEYPSNVYTSGGIWGDLERLTNGGIDYRGITQLGAEKLGEYVFYERASSLDPATANLSNKSYNINNNKAWYMLDDEQIPYALGGIGKMAFLAGINKGMKTVAPNVKPVWYAVPMSFFFQINQKAENITNSAIQNEILNGSLDYNYSGFKDYGFWFDSGVYVKVPTITSHNKYVKNADGSFVISSGKRVWNKQNFTETIYGEETLFLGEPDDGIKYLLYRTSDGATLLGSQFWNGVPSNPSPKQEYLDQGYTSWGRPNAADWKPETQLNTDFYYGFANVVICNLISACRVEYGTTDISKFKPTAKVLNYVELRLKTEEFTAGGNSMYGRQIGAGLLNFCQLFSYLSGIRAVSLWENGRDFGYDLPQRGTILYPITEAGSIQRLLDNYSGLTHRTDALNRMCQDLAGTNQADWVYIHFTYPVVIQNIQGVISSGIYTGSKFVFVMINPTLNYDETQEVTLRIKATDYKITLNGNGSVHYGVVELPTGLTNNDFSLIYTTIYNRNVIVSGKVTGHINDSVLVGL